MHLDVQWQTDPRVTVLHALRLIAEERPRIEHSIITLLLPWASKLRDLRLSPQFWNELLPSASAADLSQLVDEVARRCQPDASTSEITRLFQAAEQEVASSDLDVSEELRLRQRPLRELWEASGPGMLFQIGRWTMRPIVSRLEVQGLLPLCGGFGQAFAETERVQIELVLANPAAEVPEVIRLAWLVAQLSIPINANFSTDQLALIPCCLAAAEQLGIAQCQPTAVAKCLRQWHVNVQDEDNLGAKLHQWWNERDEDVPWSQAIVQVQQLLAR